MENDFLIYWNEATGSDVERFWLMVGNSGIDLERKNILNVILKRRRIKDIHEYDYVVDKILEAEQLGKIKGEKVVDLNKYLG